MGGARTSRRLIPLNRCTVTVAQRVDALGAYMTTLNGRSSLHRLEGSLINLLTQMSEMLFSMKGQPEENYEHLLNLFGLSDCLVINAPPRKAWGEDSCPLIS